MLYLVCLRIMVLCLKSLPDPYAQENFARAELFCLEKVIDGARGFQISCMQKQLPQTSVDTVLVFLIL